MKRQKLISHLFLCTGLLLAMSLLVLARPGFADDRDLLLSGGCTGGPNVFILFDTSSSMGNSAPCIDDGSGGCLNPPLEEDDPGSRHYQSKEAIYDLMDQYPSVYFGLGSYPQYNQERIRGFNCNGGQNCPDYKQVKGACGEPDGGPQCNQCLGWEPNNDGGPGTMFGGTTCPSANFCNGGSNSQATCTVAADCPGGSCDPAWNCGIGSAGISREQDVYCGQTFLQPTVTNARGLTVGDVVPLDWGDTNTDLIKQRMAPNIIGNPAGPPNFSVSDYFDIAGGTSNCGPGPYFSLFNPAESPLHANQRTPIGAAMGDFRHWYETDAGYPAYSGMGFKDIALANAPQEFIDRDVALILFTDGGENCGGNGVLEATNLLADHNIVTYGVGMGLTGSNLTRLNDIAVAGGTTAAINVQDGSELNIALGDIIAELGFDEEETSFTSAGTPPSEVSVRDKLYFTRFFPVDGVAHWPGQIAAFIRPLPLSGGLPDTSDTCTDPTAFGGGETDGDGCLVWEAGAQLLAQAPTQVEVDAGTYEIGPGAAQRRVYYSKDSGVGVIPRTRKSFVPPAVAADQTDLYGPTGMNTSCGSPPCVTEGEAVIKDTLVRKQVDIVDSGGSTVTMDYVLGDIFHSDPNVIGAPDRPRYFALNVEGSGGLFENCSLASSKGYRCFFDKHRNRRRMMLVGSNDGQLHFFDTGLPTLNASGNVEFDNGSGNEIASFIPRGVLPNIRQRSEGIEHQYGVDAPVRIDDVFIDPAHNGTPDPTEREWRSILIGGLREGGETMYVLDITQPDTYDSDGIPEPDNNYVASCRDGVGGECDPFPTVLWELEDTWDEDDNAAPDMGHTWSKVNTGRIRVNQFGSPRDMYVAIFGGGVDPEFLHPPMAFPPPVAAAPPPVAALTTDLKPTDDTYVKNGDATPNGTESRVYIKHNSSSKGSFRHGLFKFDLSGISGSITSATLKLHVNESTATSGILQIEEYSNDSWNEATTAWGVNYPGNGPIGAVLDSVITPTSPNPRIVDFDVTSWVQSEYAGDGTVSFSARMAADNGATGVYVFADENPQSSRDPVLSIVTSSGPSCGDSNCDPGETQCTCAVDCGSPPGSEVGLCADSVDNDCDSMTDCADVNCAADPACFVPPSCGDGSCDAGEDQCTCVVDCGSPPGTEVGLCTDSLDNDCDSSTDCADADCFPDPACFVPPSCGDGSCDAGEDTCSCAVDCGPPPGSETGLCTDVVDNDCDADVDCDDTDCSADPACSGPPPPPPGTAYAGNYLYMVDIETGNVIYKRLIDTVGGTTTAAMGPSDPAAVDIDQDGYIDTIYYGTTAGYVFKVDVSTPIDLVGTVVTEYSTGSPVVRSVTRVTDSAWDPFPIFTTGGRPIYYPPSVVFVAELGGFALAFGTGDREDIFSETMQEGRFYMVLDDGFTTGTAGLPFDETKYAEVSADIATSANTTSDFLISPDPGMEKGWFMRLAAEERLISPSTVLTGVTSFTTFLPDVVGAGATCGGTGASRIYVVLSTNANSVMQDSGADIRYREVDKFASTPFVDASHTGETGATNPCAGQAALTTSLETLFPPGCKFGNTTLNILSVRSDTGLECIAPVPVCIHERNWKEF